MNLFAESNFSARASNALAVPIQNPNAQLSARQYRRPNRRNLALVKEMLGNFFSTQLSHLNAGDVVVDSGSGYGLAAAQIAKQTGATVYAVNAQDMWQYLKEDQPETQISSLTGGKVAFGLFDVVQALDIPLDHYNLPVQTVYRKGDFIDVLDSSELNDGQRSDLKQKIFDVLDNLKQRRIYNYIVSYTETFLEGFKGQIKLFYDLYGAFVYTPNKLLLLDLAYSKLQNDGVAVFRTQSNEGDYVVLDKVQILTDSGQSKSIHLVDYLVSTYPKIFSFEVVNSVRGPTKILIMKKASGFNLNLRESLAQSEETKVITIDDMEMPLTVFNVKKR